MSEKDEQNKETSSSSNKAFVSNYKALDDDILTVPWNDANLDLYGPPENTKGSNRVRYYICPTWRSQAVALAALFLYSIVAVWASNYFPYSVIKGKLFEIFGQYLFLHLPLLWLIPCVQLGKILIVMYDSKYYIDEIGVEAHIGLVSINLRQPKLRYEDIRGVETNQNIWERFLGIGSVLIGSAMTQDIEIVMEGVAEPRALQNFINAERSRFNKQLKDGGKSGVIGD